MNRAQVLVAAVVAGAFTAAAAFDIDRRTATVRCVEPPKVVSAGVDYAALRAELAWSDVRLGDPVLKQTKTWCVPKGSKSKIKDAVEIPTHYYEIPYRTSGGVVIIRDGAGNVVHGARIDALEASERFGYEECRYWLEPTLAADYESGGARLRAAVDAAVRDYYRRQAEAILEDALFFNEAVERVPIYVFQDKKRDYADLDQAARLAESGYGGVPGDLEKAVAMWGTALSEADLGNDEVRVNRKVAAKLHENMGAALMILGRSDEAVRHLEKASGMSAVSVSRSDGTGGADLLDRARRRAERERSNPISAVPPEDRDAAMDRANAHRGRIPIDLLPTPELARLEADLRQTAGSTWLEAKRREAASGLPAAAQDAARYERMVAYSALQGFYLFLMPWPNRLETFPAAVCELTQLNQLRAPNHGFAELPDEIGNLRALRVLDLSGNRLAAVPATLGDLDGLEKLDLSGNEIASLPGTLHRLGKLKVLNLKGNPLAGGELERLKKALPGCKIKT